MPVSALKKTVHIGVIAGLALAGTAEAGQFKRLNASSLAVGGQIEALASPQNQGAAMEMDVYEYQTPPSGGSFRCRILTNTVGQTLNLRLIGVNGTIAASCAAPNNGACDLPTFVHVGNLLFQCTVATQNGAPVTVNARYTFALERPTALTEIETPAPDGAEEPRASGLLGADLSEEQGR